MIETIYLDVLFYLDIYSIVVKSRGKEMLKRCMR